MDPQLNELKLQLQSEMQKEGMVENMRTQMRYKLLERLQLQQKKPLSQQKDVKQQGDILPRRVAASIVADYLRASGHEYCLSVFIPECGFGGQLLEKEELSVLLKVEPTKQGILLELLSEIINLKPREAPKSNAATQTYTGDAIMNLEQKLNMVDSSFRSKIEGELLKPHQEIEERMLRMKRDLESRMKAELQTEIVRIREFESQTIRLDEADKQRQRMQNYREELEKSYQEKLQKLRDREKEILEKSQQKSKEIEAMSFNQRQRMMKETDHLKSKEEEIAREKALSEENIKLQKQKLEIKERELQKKLDELNSEQLNIQIQYSLRDQYDKKYKNELHHTRLSVQNEVMEEREELRAKQRVIDQDIAKINQLKENIEQLKKDNKQLVKENEKYVEQVRELKKKKKELEYELSTVKENIQSLSNVQRRDQELAKRFENDLKLRDQELDMQKKVLEHKDGMLTDHKQLQNENTKKLQQEIQNYQNRIERYEAQIKELQEQQGTKDNFYPVPYHNQSIAIPGGVQDSVLLRENIQDHRHRYNLLSHELEENKYRRHEEIRKLKEDWFQDRPAQQMKFQENWDVHGSSIQFSQGPSLFTKQPQQGGFQDQTSGSKIKQSDDPLNIFKIDEASSQILRSEVYQKGRNNKNIIEETFKEGSPYK